MSSVVWSKLRTLGPEFIRFGLVGGAATLVHAAIYTALISWTAVAPQLANLIAFLSALGISAFGHHHFTFRANEGKRSFSASSWRLGVTAILGYLLNASFVFIVEDVLEADSRLAVIPMILITPVVTYAINKGWVFYSRTGGAS